MAMVPLRHWHVERNNWGVTCSVVVGRIHDHITRQVNTAASIDSAENESQRRRSVVLGEQKADGVFLFFLELGFYTLQRCATRVVTGCM